MEESRPLVSITLLTYNHENYIRQALDGIIRQKVNFRFEVLVGDDCSKDSTQEILTEYGKKYPEIFHMILRPKNIGPTHNLYDLLKRCRGDYIAGLEGDDYWCEDDKLQKQVDFMNAHKEYIGCSHEVKMIDRWGQEIYRSGKYMEGCHWTYYQEIFTYKEYQKFMLPGQGSTYLYRNIFLNPQYDYSIIETASHMVGDMTLMLILSAQGDWYYMQGEAMTCYRYINSVGGDSWASWINTNNTLYVDYLYRCNLESYAKKVLKVKLDLSRQKFELFDASIRRYSEKGLLEDRDIIEKIWRKSNHKLWYLLKEMLIRLEDRYILPTIRYAIRHQENVTSDKQMISQTFRDFKRECRGKTLVAFGEGQVYKEFVLKYGKRFPVSCVLDNNKDKQKWECLYYKNYKGIMSDTYEWADVKSPQEIESWEPDRFVVLITSTLYFNQIARQMKEMGFHNYYSFCIMESRLWYNRIYGFIIKRKKRLK